MATARRTPAKGHRNVHEIRAPSSASELSLDLVRAQEEERKRISRELHDETGQGLMVLRLCLGALADEVREADTKSKIQQAMELLDHTIGDLRRLISRLSPRALEELGLLAAIRKEGRELSRNTGMKAHLDLPQKIEGLDQETQLTVYRCLQEALHNITKHAQAENFSVRLETGGSGLSLQIEDDGVGLSKKANAREGKYGLVGMKERVAALGGTVLLRSRKTKGTVLYVKLPVAGKGTMGRSMGREVVTFMKGVVARQAS